MGRQTSLLIISICFTVPAVSDPTMDAAYKEGTELGPTLSGVASEGKIKEAIHFKTDQPKEVEHYNAESNISQSAVSLLEGMRTSFTNDKKESAGAILLETESQREHVSLDPNNDPLFKQADAIISDPDELLAEEHFTVSEKTEDKEVICEESRPKEEFTCTRELIRAQVIDKKKVYKHSRHHGYAPGRGAGAFDRIVQHATPPAEKSHRWTDGCNWFGDHIVNIYTYFKRLVSTGSRGNSSEQWEEVTKEEYDAPAPSIPDEWSDNCGGLKVNAGAWGCQKIKEECLEGPLTKNVGGIDFTRACWKHKDTYTCGIENKNTCAPHRVKGCYDIFSRCILTHHGKCQLWEKKLNYPGKGRSRKVPAGKGNPFCYGGDCVSTDYELNKDMTEVMAKLSLLKELKGQGEDFKNGKIFEGNGSKCSKHCLNFSDCCTIKGGWGESFGLTHCSEGEKLLAKNRVAGKCHEVGTYCAEKNLGVCTLKKTSYCCYGSKLARILHEQGRAQLGLEWGSAESPNCRALTLDECKRINFELIDFSEAFQDITSQIKTPDLTKTINNFQKNWEKRLPSHPPQESTAQINKHIEERTNSLKATSPGSYSLNESPSERENKEEPEPQMVF